MGREIVFLLISLVVLAAWGIPNLMAFLSLLHPGKFRSEFEDDELDLDELDAPHRKVYASLISLGFEPLGYRTETPVVGRTVREIAFSCAEQQTFAALHGLDRENPNVYFLTPFQDGALVLTSDVQMEPVRSADFVHQGVAGRSLDVVLATHLRTANKMVSKGHEPFTRFTRKSRLKATAIYYARPEATAIQRRLRWKALGNFASSVAIVVLAGLFLAYRFLRKTSD